MPFRDAWLPVGGLLFVVGFAAAQPVVAGVGLAVVVIGGVARFWSDRLFDRVVTTVEPSERRLFIGETVRVAVALENRKALPLPWFEWRLGVAESLPVEGEALVSTATPGTNWMVRKGALGWYQKQEWHFDLRPVERGFHEIGPWRLRSSDLLGAFPRTLEQDLRRPLTVFPATYSLSDLGLPADRPFGDRKGRNRLFEDPLRVAGLREYRPGDPLRRIDWKATSRTGDLQSRVYEPSATQQVYLMVNVDTMEHAWEGYVHDELEAVVSTAASLAVWAADAKYAVGLLANGAFPNADRPIRVPPSRSRGQLTRILEALAVIQPLTSGDLAGAMHREYGRLPAGSTIVVVAALLPEALIGAISRLHSEGNHVFVAATTDRALHEVPPGIPAARVRIPAPGVPA